MTKIIGMESNSIKNIAREIVKHCAHLGMVISQDLAAYMVHLKVLDPNKGYTIEKVMARELIQNLVDACVQELSQDDLRINVIRLQVYWCSNDKTREDVAVDYHKVVYNKALPVLKEILDSNAQTKDEIENLYKRIVTFTIMFSGLGNPTTPAVIREASPALHSVFKTSELESFINLSRKEKEHQLCEFTRIVTGIRLFNKDCQKGGESIDDLPVILVQALQATKDRISSSLEQVGARILRLDCVIETVLQIKVAREKPYDTKWEPILPSGFKKEDLELAKDVSILMRQHEACLTKLSEYLDRANVAVLNLVDLLQKTLVRLHDTVRYRAAVPTVQVYPLFIELSDIWVGLQDETANLSHINTVLMNLNAINKYFDPTPFEVTVCPEAQSLTTIRTEPPAKIVRNAEFHSDVAVITPNDPDFQYLKVEFGGFCAWTTAQADGYVSPAYKDLGVLKYDGCYYAFSSPSVAYKWAKDPTVYLSRVYTTAREKPHLVHLLDLHVALINVKNENLAVIQKPIIITHNVEIQTELHPIPSLIDKDYTFSEWELKFRALHLANMANKVTKSQQTVSHSHFRTDAIVQVEKPICQETQTRKDNSCNHPTISNYIWGLRGRSDDSAHVITLTRPIGPKLSREDACKKKRKDAQNPKPCLSGESNANNTAQRRKAIPLQSSKEN